MSVQNRSLIRFLMTSTMLLCMATYGYAAPICTTPMDLWGTGTDRPPFEVQVCPSNPDLVLLSSYIMADRRFGATLFNLSTGKPVSFFDGCEAVSFSPDGKKIASVEQGRFQIWNAKTGVWLVSFRDELIGAEGFDSYGNRLGLRVLFTPDGRNILIYSVVAATLWDIQTGESLRTFNTSNINNLYVMRAPEDRAVISTDGKTLFLEQNVWNIEDGREIRLLGAGETTDGWLYSPDGAYALSQSGKLYDTATGAIIRTYNPSYYQYQYGGQWSAFSPNNKCILTIDPYINNLYILWSVDTGTVVAALPDDIGICSGAFTPDGNGLIIACEDNTILRFDVSALTGLQKGSESAACGGAWAKSFLKKQIAVPWAFDLYWNGGQISDADVFGMSAGKALLSSVAPVLTPVRQYESYGTGIYSLAFSPDGKHLLVGSSVGAKLCDAASGEIIRTYGQTAANTVMYVEGGTQVQVSRNNSVERWNTTTGELLHVLDLQPLKESTVTLADCFSQDGKRAVFGECNFYTSKSGVRVRDANTGALLREFSFDHVMLYYEISRDGTRVIIQEAFIYMSGQIAGRYGIWDIDSGALLCSVDFGYKDKGGGSWGYSGSAFTLDGKQFIASGKLWDIATGQMVREVPFGFGFWSPDGSQILSSNVLYDFATGTALRTFDLQTLPPFRYRAAFSPDGTTLAMTNDGYATVKLWEAQGCSDAVAIPYLIGVKKAAAEAMLGALGLVIGNVTTSFSSSIARDTIINQSPPADTRVEQGTTVDLEVCVGAARRVPDLAGLSRDAVISTLAGLDLSLGTETERYDDTVAAGCVISQEPASGEMVAVGTAVDIVLSKGPMPQTVPVPNVAGMVRSSAEDTLVAGGVTIGLVSESCNNSVALGLVISQTPVASTQVTSGTAVNLVVSSGPCGAEGEGEGETEGEGENTPPTESDLRDALAANFTAMDTNQDGTVSFAEALAALPGLTQAVFNALDTDANGQISTAEAGQSTEGEGEGEGEDEGGGCAGCSGGKSSLGFDQMKKSLGDLFLVGLALSMLAATGLRK